MPGGEVAIRVDLREGVIVLEATQPDGTTIELYHQHTAGIRLRPPISM